MGSLLPIIDWGNLGMLIRRLRHVTRLLGHITEMSKSQKCFLASKLRFKMKAHTLSF
jgi:hypothetical protein